MLLSSLRAALCLALCVPFAHAAEPAPLALRAILEQPVEVHGSLNYDKAGNDSSAVLYPVGGAGLAGLVAAVATHALISKGMQSAEKKRIRDQADLFLAPHRPMLDGFRMGELFNDALPLMTSSPVRRVMPASGAVSGGEVVLESVPVFYVTQDGRSIVLENVVLVRSSATGEPVQKKVRVVGAARPAEGALDFWFARNGAGLRETSASLLARSLDLALNDVRAGATTPGAFRTVRYPEGGSERMERAQVMSSTCEHLVLRTLRGDLMVVPRQDDEDAPAAADAACAAAVAQNS